MDDKQENAQKVTSIDRKRLILKELLAKITDKNKHIEVNFGCTGKEKIED